MRLDYLFNYGLISMFPDLLKQRLKLFAYCISGLYDHKIENINGTTMEQIIVSRRECRRQGRRYYSRGVDEFGYCSNTVETEYLVSVKFH